MDSASIADVRTGVFSIVQEFEEAYELFKTWRNGRVGKKAVGQEECETSLHEGKTTIEGIFDRFSLRHGARFDSGDKKSLDRILDIRKRFRDVVGDVLTSSVAEKGRRDLKQYPIALYKASEAMRKETILAMDDLSDRIVAGTAGLLRTTDPGDVLPHMPLRNLKPPRPPGASLNSSQTSLGRPPAESEASSQTSSDHQTSRTSFDNPVLGSRSANSSQTSLRIPFSPSSQRSTIFSPRSEDGEDSSTSLVKTSSSRSVLNWMFPPPKPVRPYHDITPVEPSPPVVSSVKCDKDSDTILKEGKAAARRLWAVANSTEERPQLYTHSAPLLQGPFASIWEDEPEPRPRTPLLYEREATPPTPEETSLPLLLCPARPALAQGGKRIRSEPMLQFSTPVPRVRRHVSGPSGARGE